MRPGVSTNSCSDLATFAGVVGTWSADYPVTNLGDTMEPGIVARVTPASGAAAFTATLPAARSLQFVGLVEHLVPAAGTVRVRFYSDVLTTLVHDTAAVTIPDPTSDPQTFPVLLDAAISVRSIRVDIAGLSGDLDIGACEIAQFWEFPWITEGLTAGFDASGAELPLVGGGSAGAEGDIHRTRSFEVSHLDLAVSSTTGLDFQKWQGLTRPYVYVEDYDTPSSWPRDCFLAVNSEIPPAVAILSNRDNAQFRPREHRR
jgi:hypothetical protein